MRTKILTLGLIFLVLFACEKGVNNPYSNNPSSLYLPLIHYFNSSATNTSGQMMRTLKWQVVRATKVEINNGIGEVALEGMKEIAPYEKITYVLTATNNVGQAQKIRTAGHADVVIVSGPTGTHKSQAYSVWGEVKNIGSMPSLNTRVSVELYSGSSGYGPAGELLGSNEMTVNAHGSGTLESQQQVYWSFLWSDLHQIMDFRMREGEIRYEITWEE